MAISSRSFVRLAALVGVLVAARARAALPVAMDERPFRALDAPLAAGATVVLEPVSLDEGTVVVLELALVEPFTKDAQIVVHGPEGDSLAPLPTDRWFTGRVLGDPESFVMLARGRGLRGFIVSGTWGAAIAPESGADAGRPGRTLVQRFSPETGAPETMRGFTCGTESLFTPHRGAVSPLSSRRQALSSVMYYASIAIETDYEMYLKKGSSSALAQYVGDLFAAISAVYQRDILVTLQVNYLSIWTTASDPWSGADTHSSLYEFGDYWHANRSAVPRTTAHFLSGRALGGGVAWISVLCRADFLCSGGSCGDAAANGHYGGGYGFTASLSGASPADFTTTYWDFFAVAHEIGHNFSSPHTHCYSPPVDTCYSGESGCYSGATSVPAVKGTIMSYCHLLSGGYGNIKMYFGVAGEPSAVVTTKMRTYVEGNPACFGTVAGPTVSTVSPPAGSVGGATPVTITGSSFIAGATVKIGGVAATGVNVANPGTITATTGAHAAGAVDVLVTNPDNQAYTAAGLYTYSAAANPPVATSINPNFGSTPGSTPVTITGSSFVSGATVSIGGAATSSVNVVNSATITALTGAHATGTVNVVVTNPDTQAGTLTSGYFYVPPAVGVKFYTVTPCRVADTRNPNGLLGGPALVANQPRLFTLTVPLCGIPTSAVAVSANLTITQPGAAGVLALYPGNGISSGASSLNFATGKTRANNTMLYLATDGTGGVNVMNGSAATTHFILDVNGYFQ